ncbi:hypothetical protein D3C80_2031820 [compost metagenome]
MVSLLDSHHRQQIGGDDLPVNAFSFVRVNVNVTPPHHQVYRCFVMAQPRSGITGHVGSNKLPAIGTQGRRNTILSAVLRVTVRLF